MNLAISCLAVLLIIAANFFAFAAGSNHNTRLHRAAGLSGIFGMASALGLVVAFVDAFTQIWVKRPGYEGLPVIVFFVTTVALTIASLGLGIAVAVRDRRAGA